MLGGKKVPNQSLKPVKNTMASQNVPNLQQVRLASQIELAQNLKKQPHTVHCMRKLGRIIAYMF